MYIHLHDSVTGQTESHFIITYETNYNETTTSVNIRFREKAQNKPGCLLLAIENGDALKILFL